MINLIMGNVLSLSPLAIEFIGEILGGLILNFIIVFCTIQILEKMNDINISKEKKKKIYKTVFALSIPLSLIFHFV